MAVNQPQLVDFSRTQRLVFLIDLQPLLTFQNSSAYIAIVTSAASRLLRFPPLSTSLFAYKFFFSSLSPLRSADVLACHRCSPSLSFNFPLETLASLSTNLNSVLALIDLPNPPGKPLVQHFQSVLLQLIHDYGWENEREISVGSLKPFTAHSAILSIVDRDNALSNCISQSRLQKIDDRACDNCAEDLPDSNPCFGSQTESSTSGNYENHAVGKRNKKRIHLYQQMTWSSFCKAAFEGSQMDLFEVYTTGHIENSKKLKFLKCWMKQIDKIDPYCSRTSHLSKSTEEFSAACVPSAMEEGMLTSSSDTSESFFNNLPKRIQQGLESGIDLQILAQRVVKSSIHWLHQKHETTNNSIDQSQMQIRKGSTSDSFAVKLMELLLREPKEMKEMHEDQDSSSKASQPPSSSENICDSYELQIFLRMEIMRSDVSAIIEESQKQKLLKQICSLLEIIQYLVAGGIHGHISLYDYVERAIKGRYSNELEDIVNKIYTKMDFLPFGDEEETPNLLFNSEDSNQSWKDKHERAEAHSISQSISAEEEYSNREENRKEPGENDHSQMLSKARERRERARRFVSFTSRVQDLQRVWAPKQQQKMKDKFDSLPKQLKRKDWHEPSYSVVHETPLTGNKRGCIKRGKKQEDFRNSNSVSKALFQDICPGDK
ncbi:hypothetical protein F511_13991 [Dorcoceras hygrometricum]|uniref:Uncharacterized protein n=1 Tax=Dorcoceras hygrometricum TaxID=472368 RepID=A0A2Z7C277_9LAMI|nr:hypothetical protein F511_13991 [Dorcoceras hygrometricum]